MLLKSAERQQLVWDVARQTAAISIHDRIDFQVGLHFNFQSGVRARPRDTTRPENPTRYCPYGVHTWHTWHLAYLALGVLNSIVIYNGLVTASIFVYVRPLNPTP